MAEIVNLKQKRKHKARAEKDATAKANRVRHGTPKHLRAHNKAEEAQAARHLAGHKLTDETHDGE